MKIHTHFNVGDVAYRVTSRWRELFVECPSCVGGFLTMKNDEKLKCPRCNGKGAVSERGANVFHVDSALTVGQIRIQIDKDETSEEYMCEETGVGSGSIYKLEDMFKTKELAQAEADLRNHVGGKSWVCISCQPQYNSLHWSIGFDSRMWRHCSIHDNTQHVVKEVADKILEERKQKETADVE